MADAAASRTRASAALVAGLAGLLFGFDTAVVSGVTAALRDEFALGPAGLGLAVSAALWGTLAGAAGAGPPGDRYGSRAMLGLVGVLYLVSAVGCALAPGLAGFALFRFVGGLAIGASSVLAPVYLAEISPPARRGLVVGLFQFNIVLGILVAYGSNYLVAQVAPPDVAWRWKLAVAAAPAVLFTALLRGVPPSPAWLRARGRAGEAADAARRLDLPLAAERAPDPDAPRARLGWARHRRPIALAVLVALFNQLSGVNAVLYYLNDIFAAAGFAAVSADAQAVAVGLANLVATAAGMLLVDRVGRKPLLVAGGLGVAAALAGVALVFEGVAGPGLLLPALLAFIAAFAMSQGAVIWVYLSEIFPAEVRARGQALGSATHWVANAAIAGAFPLVAARAGALPFWIFAGAMLLQAAVVWRSFPETRNRRLD